MAEDLSGDPKILGVNELMNRLEADIAEAKSGEVKESVARIVSNNRRTQTKLIELELQASRQDTKIRSGLIRRFGQIIDITPARPGIAPPNGEPGAEAKPDADKPKEGT